MLFKDGSPTARWDYTSGLFAHSLLSLSDRCREPSIADYAAKLVDSFIVADGSIATYQQSDFNLDMITPGRAVLTLYEKSRDPRLKIAPAHLHDQIAKHTYDPASGLFCHGWDEKHAQAWANPDTGCSPNFWGRSIGWYGMALVDCLGDLPPAHRDAEAARQVLSRLAEGIARCQDSETGLW